MDLFTIPSLKLRKMAKKSDIGHQEITIVGKTTPLSQRYRTQTSSPTSRTNTHSAQKSDNKSIIQDLFENLHINRTFTKRTQNTSFELQKPEQQKTFVPEIKILKKKKNGLITFQQVPRILIPQKQYDFERDFCVTPNWSKRKQKTRRILDLATLKQCQLKDNQFKERNLYLNELLWDSF